MEWVEALGYFVMIAAVIFCVWGYIRKGMSLKNALGALQEIRALVVYAKGAMSDGSLSAIERDEIIDRVAEIAKRFV